MPSFLTWMLLYPLICTICRYLDSQSRRLNNQPPLPEKTTDLRDALETLLWALIGYCLWLAHSPN